MNAIRFAEKYGYPEWMIRFRPKAPRTSFFGWRVLGDDLSWHNGVDSGESENTGFDVYVPFTVAKMEYIKDVPAAYGSLLIMKFVETDFEFRIAHMAEHDLSPETRMATQFYRPMATGQLLGICGDLGTSFGRHAHVEMVSCGAYSEMAEQFLLLRFGNEIYEHGHPGYDEEFHKEHEVKNFNLRAAEIKQERGMMFYNRFMCRRCDYLDNKFKTWYSTYLTFNGL